MSAVRQVSSAGHRLASLVGPLVRTIGALVLALAVVETLGVHARTDALIQPQPPQGAVQYRVALAFALSGGGLLLLSASRRRAARLAGLLVMALALQALYEYAAQPAVPLDELLLDPLIAGHALVPAPMALNAALAFLLSGAYLLGVGISRASRRGILLLGLISSVVLGLGGIALLGHVSGVEAAYAWGSSSAMPPATAAGFLLLATGFFAWLLVPVGGAAPTAWIPAAAGVLVLTLAVGLWWALHSREEAQLRSLVGSRATLVTEEIQDLILSRVSALDRMAARWEASGGTPRSQWEADAAQYLSHDPGLVAIEYVDGQLVGQWLVSSPDFASSAALWAKHPDVAEALQLARASGSNTLTQPVDVQTGEPAILILSPITRRGEFDGLIIGVSPTQDLFLNLLPHETMQEVSLALYHNDRQFFGPETGDQLYARWRVERQIPVLDQPWKLVVWPREALINTASTAIPEITLALGSVVGILLSLTLLFAQRSQLRTEELESLVRARTAELLTSLEALRDSEERYSEIYENAPDMFLSVDAVYATILRCNQTLADTVGVSKRELIGQPVTALYHPESHPKVRWAFRQLLHSGEVQHAELKLLRADGGTVDVLVNDSAIRDDSGQVLYGSAVIRDITSLNSARRERDRLLELEREQRRIAETLARVALALSATLELENLVELICKESVSLFDVGAAFVWLVEGEELVGRSGYGKGREQFIGQRVALDDPNLLAARVIRDRRPLYVNHAMRSNEALRRLVELFEVQSLLGVPLLKGLKPIGALMILDAEDPERFGPEDLEIASVLGSHVSVAVQNARLYERERQLAQMKDNFIAHVSHELRTPLHTLRGFIQLLQSGKVSDENVRRDFLARAAHDADRLGEQVSELLEAAHIDAGGLRLDFQDIDVGRVVQQTLDSIRIIAEDRGVQLHNFVPVQGPIIRSEERRLRQVVRNLVENAVQFSEAGSAVEVSAEQHNGELRLLVRDQGPGIAPEAMERLFTRFYQVDSAGRRERGGVGLGLYITRMIVEAHGGRIEVESRVGEGSTFQAILPVSQPEAVKDGSL